nr:hypothetical protein [Tanacetum cinerariifolium]
MVADLRYFNSLELEVDSLKSQLETQKTQILNEIDRLSREYYYADHINAILGVYTELDEVTNLQCDYLETLEKCECLEKELSKSKMMSKSFEALQKHAVNLELDLQQCKEKIKNDKSFKEIQSKEFRKERKQYFEIQDLKAQLQDKGIAINSLEKKDCSKSKSVTKNNVSNDFSKPITAQILPLNRVIPSTSVSKPHIRSNRMKDRVMLNNSQGKKQEVEDQRRNVKFSNNKTSVTACNDSLKAKTSSVNFVCVTCGKCVLNDNHDKCVLHYLNGVNSRNKMPDLDSTPKNDHFDTKSYLLESLLNRDESIPPSIDIDDSDFEGDNLFLERLLHDDPIPLLDTLDFSYDVRVFLPFFTYPVTSSIPLSYGSEDIIFDSSIYHFYPLEPGVSHRSGTFMKFNIYPHHLNESPMEILSSTCSPMDQ